MWVRFQFENNWIMADTSKPISLAHQIVPNEEPTVSAFYLSAATSTPVEAGEFVGDTRRGGSVNCEVLHIAPHGNGTHTEGVGHITDARIPVTNALPAPLMLTMLLDVAPVRLKDVKETYSGQHDGDDWVITARALENAWQKSNTFDLSPPAFVIRACKDFFRDEAALFSGRNPPTSLIRPWVGFEPWAPLICSPISPVWIAKMMGEGCVPIAFFGNSKIKPMSPQAKPKHAPLQNCATSPKICQKEFIY